MNKTWLALGAIALASAAILIDIRKPAFEPAKNMVLTEGDDQADGPAWLSSKDHARTTIESCWQGYERKSLDPPSKRAIARMCEDMESQFRAKYKTNP